MTQPSESVAHQLAQLNAARNLVLGDAAFYPQIVQGILPIISAGARLELRRWGADFLAETFASPALPMQQKQQLAVSVVQTLREVLDIPGEDPAVVKSVAQAAASIYPLIFRHIINNPSDSAVWDQMVAIKQKLLRFWDISDIGVRTCCIKFVQKVVQVQTSGVIADPRRPDQNEISLALVPRNHALIPPPNLEAEAMGLLDRLLNVFHDESSEAVLVNATLNCLAPLIRSRPSIANRIINAVLNFNPLKQANSPMTPKIKVLVKSMARTTRALLKSIIQRNSNNPLAGRIQQYIDRITQSQTDIFDEGSRKRTAPVEPTDGLDQAKRVRLGAEVPETNNELASIPPLPSGPTSFAQLFTLTQDEALTSFDITQLPIDMVVRITPPILHRIDQRLLENAINGIRSRYLSLSNQRSQSSGAPAGDDDDDYEPDYEPAEDPEQLLNKLDSPMPSDIAKDIGMSLGRFELPQAPQFTAEETKRIAQGTVTRVFSMMTSLEESSRGKSKSGINRLAASSYDRDSWVTVITRLATRTPMDAGISDEPSRFNVSDTIREALYVFVIEDFRRRIDIAISWLNEEWYNDKIRMQETGATCQFYEKWALKVLDGILPYLDARDKVLIRLLSEIPSVNKALLERVKSLAHDPERVTLATNAIHYLILLRPPVRKLCIDALEDLWRNYEDARTPAAKLLTKWRPDILRLDEASGTNGIHERMVETPPSASNAVAA